MNLNNTLLIIYDYLYHNENDRDIIEIINKTIRSQHIFILNFSRFEYQKNEYGNKIKFTATDFSTFNIHDNNSYTNSTYLEPRYMNIIFDSMLAYIKYKNRKNIIESICDE